MDLSFQTIGSFQFENLYKNRIPFLLIHFGQNFGEVFEGHYLTLAQARLVDAKEFIAEKNWLRKNVVRPFFSEAEISALLKRLGELEIPNHYAIVAVSEDGRDAQELMKVLTEKGFTNTFCVEGGMAMLRQELKKN